MNGLNPRPLSPARQKKILQRIPRPAKTGGTRPKRGVQNVKLGAQQRRRKSAAQSAPRKNSARQSDRCVGNWRGFDREKRRAPVPPQNPSRPATPTPGRSSPLPGGGLRFVFPVGPPPVTGARWKVPRPVSNLNCFRHDHLQSSSRTGPPARESGMMVRGGMRSHRKMSEPPLYFTGTGGG